MAEETGRTPPRREGESSPESYERGAGGVAALLRDTMRKPVENEEAAPGESPDENETAPDAKAPDGGGSGEPDQELAAPQEITDDDDDELAGGDTDDQELAAQSLSELAKAAGVSIQDLYTVEIPLGDERGSTTLGEIKDRFRDLQRVDQVRDQMESQRTEFENSMIRARGELNEIVNLLPSVPPELLEQAREQHRSTRDAERQSLLDVKPEWRDDAKFEAAQSEIVEAIADYGFKRGDFDLVMDHRLVKLLHDFAGMKRKLASADTLGKEVRESGRLQRGRGGGRKQTKQTRGDLDNLIEKAKDGDKAAQGQAVERLISNAGVRTR